MTHSEKKFFYESLGNRIREARSTAKIKQEIFASYLSLSRSSIVNIEKGRQHPQIHLLWDIARLLNIKITDLLPEQTATGELSSQWSKIISQGSQGNKRTKEKLMSFVEEVKSSKK